MKSMFWSVTMVSFCINLHRNYQCNIYLHLQLSVALFLQSVFPVAYIFLLGVLGDVALPGFLAPPSLLLFSDWLRFFPSVLCWCISSVHENVQFGVALWAGGLFLCQAVPVYYEIYEHVLIIQWHLLCNVELWEM